MNDKCDVCLEEFKNLNPWTGQHLCDKCMDDLEVAIDALAKTEDA